MNVRASLAGVLVAAAAATAACGGSGAGASQSPSASAKATTATHDALDPPTPTPTAFPADVPVYPGARLTAGAAFAGSGETTFGMEWESLDGIDKVHAFYASKLNQGDWTISFSGATGTAFTAVFSKKGSKETGVVAADGSSGVTKISLSLVLPGGQ